MINRRHTTSLAQILVIVTILAVCLTGCFGSKTPQRSYFSIDYTLGTQPQEKTPKYSQTVVVQNIQSALAYDRQEIIYRSNPYEFQYYWYKLWASKPKKMLRELITGHLRYTNLFASVSDTIEDRMPDYMLDVGIDAIEELDVSEKEWYAHLSLRFNMTKVDDKTSVWTYEFDARRPVADNQPVYVVKALSELLDTELVKAFQDLDNTLVRKSHKATTAPIDFEETEDNIEDTKDNSENQPRAVLKNKP
ncbi:MAG: membrane integrity-associated transporter subunit PqiC [Proteobacteria bacterium]|nr:membrane integrity-associated transporter subunit PqiC [Pseudomonadota bacterium]